MVKMMLCEAAKECQHYNNCFHSKPHEEIPLCSYRMICRIANKKVVCKEIKHEN